MSVIIDPAELGFHRPFIVEVAETLRIENPNAFPVAFKVKTTAPKQYCVRPNSGRIEPDRYIDVTVLLQAMKNEPPLNYKCRDKFLVQSVPITADKDFVGIQQIWDNVEKANIQEKKIRVVFLSSEGMEDPDSLTPVRPSTATESATPEAPPLTFTSPRETSHYANGVVSTGDSSPDGKSDVVAAKTSEEPSVPPAAPHRGSSASSGSPSAATPLSESKDNTIATLTARLAEAEALIASLRTDGGLRQRKGASAASAAVPEKAVASATATDAAVPKLDMAVRQGTEGVPVQVTALLCLLSFLLAYFFF